MTTDATTQGDETTDQDVMEGLDFDPVTAPSSEQEGQADPAPKTPPAPKPKEGEGEGAVKTPNAEAKNKRIDTKNTKITQETWQETQERIANQDREIALMRIEKDQAKFEAKNPIVLNEKYEAKWIELCKQKLDPEHKYHKLDFSDLRMLLLNPEDASANEEAIEEYEKNEEEKPTPQPRLGGGHGNSTKMPGGTDAETYSNLKALGYTDAQIAESDGIDLSSRSR